MALAMRLGRLLSVFLAATVALWAFHIQRFLLTTSVSIQSVGLWSLAQWMPLFGVPRATELQTESWEQWQKEYSVAGEEIEWTVPLIDLNLVDSSQISHLIESQFGLDWRQRPLLLKGLWNATIRKDSTRRLSLSGLQQERLKIPYFRDASAPGRLTPDSSAPVSDIVANISKLAACTHKITTQLVIQTHPELILEVAPSHIVTQLFGDYFEPRHIRGSGPFGLFPAMTTVPLFVARSTSNTTQQPRTDLHCEPIGNVAVQLEGSKKWTLVRPQDTFRLRPLLAPDGRAYVASMVGQRFSNTEEWKSIPRAHVVTHAGDALWVPPWTWHRVDYTPVSADEAAVVAIGASLFHFRPRDFFVNNPLFALLILPSLVKELIGCNTQ